MIVGANGVKNDIYSYENARCIKLDIKKDAIERDFSVGCFMKDQLILTGGPLRDHVRHMKLKKRN